METITVASSRVSSFSDVEILLGSAIVIAVVTTIAGVPGAGGDLDGPFNTALFKLPFGIARDSQGNLLIADRFNNAIRKINPQGTVSTLAGPTGATALFLPTGAAPGPDGSIYFTDFGTSVVRRLFPNGQVGLVAGIPNNFGNANFPSPGIFNKTECLLTRLLECQARLLPEPLANQSLLSGFTMTQQTGVANARRPSDYDLRRPGLVSVGVLHGDRLGAWHLDHEPNHRRSVAHGPSGARSLSTQ